MSERVRYTLRGLGTLPGYGPHPGTSAIAALTAVSSLSGALSAGLYGAFLGAGVMLIGMGPFYLWGAYERGRDNARSQP